MEFCEAVCFHEVTKTDWRISIKFYSPRKSNVRFAGGGLTTLPIGS
jgi:hypothetical protein